jgi:hypothetical protein
MMAMELARELKVAGLPWKPRRGDLTMDRLNDLFVVLQDGSDGAGGVVIDTGAGQEHKHFLMLTWIPRLEQALTFLARYGPCSLTARPAGDPDAADGAAATAATAATAVTARSRRTDVRWRVTLPPAAADGAAGAAPTTGRVFEATDPADAAGRALHYLLAEQGWLPGPALSGW